MTTAKTPQTFRLPDAPEHPEDKMTNFDHLDQHQHRRTTEALSGQPANHPDKRGQIPL